jgi:hypothetical protein
VTYKLRTIAISECNYSALKGLGQAGDSFNDVIAKLLLDYFDNAGKIPLSQHAADERKRDGGEAQ